MLCHNEALIVAIVSLSTPRKRLKTFQTEKRLAIDFSAGIILLPQLNEGLGTPSCGQQDISQCHIYHYLRQNQHGCAYLVDPFLYLLV